MIYKSYIIIVHMHKYIDCDKVFKNNVNHDITCNVSIRLNIDTFSV